MAGGHGEGRRRTNRGRISHTVTAAPFWNRQVLYDQRLHRVPSGRRVYHTRVSEKPGKTALIIEEGPGWLAAFASAAEVPGQLSAHQLAERASAWARRTLGRHVPVLYADQRHTAVIFTFAAHQPLVPRPHCVGVCDGLLTADRGVALTVRTADCLPVVVAGGKVVAALHCGWRSLAGDILGKCVRRFFTEFGVHAHQLRAVIGVGIGPCHYPIGREVATALATLPVADESWYAEGRADLAAWARGRLVAAGVSRGAIRTLPGCTACSAHHHSFRRDGAAAGRQWAAVVLI